MVYFQALQMCLNTFLVLSTTVWPELSYCGSEPKSNDFPLSLVYPIVFLS